MTRRITLAELDLRIANELARGEWLTPSELCDRLGIGHGLNWYQVALLLERAVVDGHAEIKRPGARGARRFRGTRP